MWRWHKHKVWAMVLIMLCSAFGAHAQATKELTVTTATGSHILSVEIADTTFLRHRGLMERQSMPLDHGMLFVFKEEMPLSFWMKNTPLSLDIIYFDGRGHYINHHVATTPNSLDSLKSARPAQYVLEINAGHAATLSITQGSQLILPISLGG